MGVVKDGGICRSGVARSLENICNHVFTKADIVSSFNVILKSSWRKGRLPSYLLFTQALAVCLVTVVVCVVLVVVSCFVLE